MQQDSCCTIGLSVCHHSHITIYSFSIKDFGWYLGLFVTSRSQDGKGRGRQLVPQQHQHQKQQQQNNNFKKGNDRTTETSATLATTSTSAMKVYLCPLPPSFLPSFLPPSNYLELIKISPSPSNDFINTTNHKV